MKAISSAIVNSVTSFNTQSLTEEHLEKMMSDQARQDDLLQKIDNYLEQHETLMDAYGKLEPHHSQAVWRRTNEYFPAPQTAPGSGSAL